MTAPKAHLSTTSKRPIVHRRGLVTLLKMLGKEPWKACFLRQWIILLLKGVMHLSKDLQTPPKIVVTGGWVLGLNIGAPRFCV